MSEEDAKEQKPKKMFTITIDIYDSGDVDAIMCEYRKSASGLGRPQKWLLTAPDFVRRVEDLLGDYNKCLYEWNNAIGKEAKQYIDMTPVTPQITQISPSSSISFEKPIDKKEEKKDKYSKQPKKEQKSEEPESTDEDDGFGNIEFGEFDKPTDNK
jgi:hypothetical protein